MLKVLGGLKTTNLFDVPLNGVARVVEKCPLGCTIGGTAPHLEITSHSSGRANSDLFLFRQEIPTTFTRHPPFD